MKYFITLSVFMMTTMCTHALVINEILSNPLGDDSGREWVEIYNNSDSDVDVTSLTLSIKGGALIPVTQVSGGTTIAAHGYAIIGSTVSGQTRFMLDYPSYNGPLFKSSMSLVNSGITSLELKLQSSAVDTLTSYTAAKEGSSYSLLSGSFGTGIPTPGEENKAQIAEDVAVSASQSGTQATLPQASPPAADIMLYLPKEKTVVAGAPAIFSVYSSTSAGKSIDNMTYVWGFGDGGFRVGSSTLYTYFYPGRYIAQVEGTNGLIAGTGRMSVRVVSPDISISPIGIGKYGNYVDITNPNIYELDISLWEITIDGVPFSFPKNTVLAQGVTRFPGIALGFASTTISSSTVIRLLFQNSDEVIRISQGSTESIGVQESRGRSFVKTSFQSTSLPKRATQNQPQVIFGTTSLTKPNIVKAAVKKEEKDVRLATFIKSLFGK